jgi:hypothetical protein
MRRGLSKGRIVIVVLALLVINVPFIGHLYTEHRLNTDGVQVTAAVVDVTPKGDGDVVSFRFPAAVDPSRALRSSTVDAATGRRAAATHSIGVLVLKSNPGIYRADGELPSHAALIATLVANALIILFVVLSIANVGRFRRPALEAVALGDVTQGEEGSLLDKQPDDTYLIQGAVRESGPDVLLLGLRDRDVTVHLRGYRNPVAVGEQARVMAHLVG